VVACLLWIDNTFVAVKSAAKHVESGRQVRGREAGRQAVTNGVDFESHAVMRRLQDGRPSKSSNPSPCKSSTKWPRVHQVRQAVPCHGCQRRSSTLVWMAQVKQAHGVKRLGSGRRRARTYSSSHATPFSLCFAMPRCQVSNCRHRTSHVEEAVNTPSTVASWS